MSNLTRRHFVKSASLSAATLGLTGFTQGEDISKPKAYRKSREVWIASLTQNRIGGSDYKEAIQQALQKMEHVVSFSPDIVCLPEVFHVAGIKGGRPPLKASAEDGTGKIIGPFQSFAKDNKCFVICPVYTVENGKFYNAAIVIDRQGKKIGEYRKARLTVGEMEKGLTPGPLDFPVFQTDFGVIGIQICYDIEWPDGWHQLREKGAEIVFWPSAFAAGKKINTKAWENQYCVVSSTRKDTTKICDITGEELAVSGIFSQWGVCAPVNLEKAFLHSWPHSLKFADIQKKYGRNVRCYSLHEEEFSVIESLSPDLKVSDILKEFKLETYRQHLQKAEDQQNSLRA
jgi:predicted amidohydrolase